jgi:hypothetical protein
LLCTVTWGGASSGYCAIGRVVTLTAPRRTIKIAHTEAKTGRRMKKLTNK